jgi:hypothetical protein
MVCFKTKNPDLGIFWRALKWKMLAYLMVIWHDLWQLGILPIWLFGVVCGHLVYCSRFGTFGARKIWQPWAHERNGFGGKTEKTICGAKYFHRHFSPDRFSD